MVVIDVTPRNCIKRIEKREKGKELCEKRSKIEKDYFSYKKVLKDFQKKSKIYFVNGERPIKLVFEEIKNKINAEKII